MSKTINEQQNNQKYIQDYSDGIFQSYEQILQLRQKVARGQNNHRYTFTLGVMNMVLSALIFGKYPQYFWIVYFVKIFTYIPIRLYIGYKAKENYYLLDFCWISVFVTGFLFIIYMTGFIPEMYAQLINRIIFIFSNGPQGLSAITFSNALVFHSFQHTCSLFIHITPVAASYTLRWNYPQILEEFSDKFPSNLYGQDNNLFNDFFFPAFKVYMVWWTIYSIWLCYHGLGLPTKGYDTVFNWLYTSKPAVKQILDNIANKLFKRKYSMQGKTKVLIFMTIHMIYASISMLWGYLCYQNELLHFVYLFSLVLAVVYQASGYYQYYSMDAPKQTMEKFIMQKQLPIPKEYVKEFYRCQTKECRRKILIKTFIKKLKDKVLKRKNKVKEN